MQIVGPLSIRPFARAWRSSPRLIQKSVMVYLVALIAGMPCFGVAVKTITEPTPVREAKNVLIVKSPPYIYSQNAVDLRVKAFLGQNRMVFWLDRYHYRLIGVHDSLVVDGVERLEIRQRRAEEPCHFCFQAGTLSRGASRVRRSYGYPKFLPDLHFASYQQAQPGSLVDANLSLGSADSIRGTTSHCGEVGLNFSDLRVDTVSAVSEVVSGIHLIPGRRSHVISSISLPPGSLGHLAGVFAPSVHLVPLKCYGDCARHSSQSDDYRQKNHHRDGEFHRPHPVEETNPRRFWWSLGFGICFAGLLVPASLACLFFLGEGWGWGLSSVACCALLLALSCWCFFHAFLALSLSRAGSLQQVQP